MWLVGRNQLIDTLHRFRQIEKRIEKTEDGRTLKRLYPVSDLMTDDQIDRLADLGVSEQ